MNKSWRTPYEERLDALSRRRREWLIPSLCTVALLMMLASIPWLVGWAKAQPKKDLLHRAPGRWFRLRECPHVDGKLPFVQFFEQCADEIDRRCKGEGREKENSDGKETGGSQKGQGPESQEQGQQQRGGFPAAW